MVTGLGTGKAPSLVLGAALGLDSNMVETGELAGDCAISVVDASFGVVDAVLAGAEEGVDSGVDEGVSTELNAGVDEGVSTGELDAELADGLEDSDETDEGAATIEELSGVEDDGLGVPADALAVED